VDPAMSTKPRACLSPAFGYTETRAEPRVFSAAPDRSAAGFCIPIFEPNPDLRPHLDRGSARQSA